MAFALAHGAHNHSVKYALVNSDPQLAERPFQERASLCYQWDRAMVEEAELVIAEASFPSTGLGIELQVAAARGTAVILCFRDFGSNHVSPVVYENPDHVRHELQIGEGYVSLMALGVPTVVRVVRYQSSADGLVQLGEAVDGLVQAPPT